jgi:hypothetical protein
MGLFGGLGKLFNTITAPVGVKLFSGGPYADAGMGDKAQGQLAQLEAIARYLQQIQADPSSPLNLRQAAQDIYARMGMYDQANDQIDPSQIEALNQQMTGLRDAQRYQSQAETQYGQDLPYIRQAVDRYDQLQSGGLMPLEGVAAQFPELLRAYMQQSNIDPQNPYAQTNAEGVQRASLQNKATNDKQAALSQLRARFAQRGITSPAAIAAAEARINQMYDTGANNSLAGFDESARKARAEALQNAMAQIFQASGLQQGQHQLRLQGAQQNIANRSNFANQRSQAVNDLYGLAVQRSGLGGQIASQREQLKQNRLNNMQNSIANRQALYSMGQNALNSAGNMLSGNANQFMNLGSLAENRNNNALSQLGGLAGMIFGGGLGNQSGFGQLGNQRTKRKGVPSTPPTIPWGEYYGSGF